MYEEPQQNGALTLDNFTIETITQKLHGINYTYSILQKGALPRFDLFYILPAMNIHSWNKYESTMDQEL